MTPPLSPLQYIRFVIDTIGPRRAGSAAEAAAQQDFKTRLEAFCSQVEVHDFKAALRSKFGSLKLFSLLWWGSIGLSWVNIWAAGAIAGVSAVLYFFHFLIYRHILDFLWPKLASSNVTGTLEPQGEVRATVVIAGHMDSTPEFIWWYWFKNTGARMMVAAGLGMVAFPIFCLAAGLLAPDGAQWVSIVRWVFVGLAPLALTFFFIHGKKMAPGAQDNLSGIATALHAGYLLASGGGKSSLQHTRIKIVSFGSEETGLRGSHAYAQHYQALLKAENARLLNLDGIMYLEHTHVVEREPFSLTRYPEAEVARLEAAFSKHSVPTQRATLPIGSTDGASFVRFGLPAVTVISQPLGGLHPTYHTRLDTPEWLNDDCLTKTAEVCADYARMVDAEVSR